MMGDRQPLLTDEIVQEEEELYNGYLNGGTDLKPHEKLKPQHCHDRQSAEDPEMMKRSRRKLICAIVLVFVFMLCEMIGGYIANSLAIATDAVHLLTDCTAFVINLVAMEMATRKPTARLNFGWYRLEIIGAMVSILLLWTATGVLLYLSVERVIHQNFHIDPTLMMIMAGLDVFFNIVQSLNLGGIHGHSHGGGGHGHSHGGGGHGHSHGKSNNDKSDPEKNDKDKKGKKVNINVRASMVHVMGDLAQSFGVFIASLILYFQPTWVIVDPICTFTFSVIVVITTSFIVKDIIVTLMEGVPSDMDFEEIKEELTGLPGVTQLHDLRLWSLTSHKTYATVHLVLDNPFDPDPFTISTQAEIILKQKYGIHSVTIQMEIYSEMMRSCTKCIPNGSV